MTNYPMPYQPQWGYSGTYNTYPAQQSMSQPVQQASYTAPQSQGIHWVDGEAEAKGTAMPAWKTQYAMWDINEPVIYIKSLNQMGMPNKMRTAHYWFEDEDGEKQSGEEKPAHDMTEYVRKEDMEHMKRELMDTINGLSISGRRESEKRESSF